MPPCSESTSNHRVAPLGRLLALGVAAGCLTVLLVAAWLSPSANGHGTHTGLGLPPCAWVMAGGYPCPTCGMTTAFAQAVRAKPVESFHAQPMGAALALATAVGFWLSLVAAVTGARLHLVVSRWLQPRVLWVLAILWAASWGYKIITWRG